MSLTPEGYVPRLLQDKLAFYLQTFGAVEVRGPKWCGKTWLSLSQAGSVVHLDDADVRRAVEVNHALALAGEAPHLIDEWQEVPDIWDDVRRAVDASGSAAGTFILTGSSRPSGKEQARHSGAGRIARLNLQPMSLYELGLSDGSASLSALLKGEGISDKPVQTSLGTIAHAICQGGWPGAIGRSERAARIIPTQYIEALCDPSARLKEEGIQPDVLRRVLVALARNEGGSPSMATLSADVSMGEGGDAGTDASAPSAQILERYLSYLREQYLVRDLRGWDAPVRARARVRSRPKRYLVDPSLSAALLGFDEERLQWDAQAFGLMFESLCMRDIATYLEASTDLPTPSMYYYRDSYGLEVDCIVELADGTWAGIEMKLSASKEDQAANSLLRLRDKVRANPAARNPEPAFLAVLVGDAPFMYRRADGVDVIPITCLGA